jgi:hypothetical protein
MSTFLFLLLLYILISMWDVGRVNQLIAKFVDPAAYLRAHPAPAPEPAPRLALNLPVADRLSS